jgi:hypothetical protein
MKKTLLFSVLSFAFILSLQAQHNIQLNIHHKLGDIDFAMNTGAKNNLGDDFSVTRLQYYISGISIVHDNGQVTPIDSFFILVDASLPTEVTLGNYPIDNVEGIHFYIGVDAAHNHTDPAGYDPSHPLSPKSPSMHWGWASGYRFMAFEGNGGPQYNQLIQLHGLGDQNYVKTRVNLSATAANDEVIINLDADYTRALEDISVSGGLIVHSELGEAQHALENFRNLVFSPSEINTGSTDFNLLNNLALFPNPSADGQFVACINSAEDGPYQIIITDIMGHQADTRPDLQPNTNVPLEVRQPGIYFIRLLKNGNTVCTKKLIVQ